MAKWFSTRSNDGGSVEWLPLSSMCETFVPFGPSMRLAGDLDVKTRLDSDEPERPEKILDSEQFSLLRMLVTSG